MDSRDARKLYDELDHVYNKAKNWRDYSAPIIGDQHSQAMRYNFTQLTSYAELLLGYMAKEVIPDLEKHPDQKPVGGVYIDGVRT